MGWLPTGGGSSSPLTTKGDVWGYDTADARIPVGSDGQVLKADSSEALGVKWAAPGGGVAGGVSGARVTRTTNQTLTTATVTPIDWDSQDYDTDDYWEGVTNPERFTVPTAGKYRVSAVITWGANSTGRRHLRFHVNGVEQTTLATDPVGSAAYGMAASETFDLAAGDYVTVEAYQTSGGNLDLISTSGKTLTASIERISSGSNLGTGSELTIASGAVTVTQGFHTIDTESDAATDDLDTINGGLTGDVIVLKSAADARDPTLKDGTGNLALAGDFTLSDTDDTIMLIYDGTSWCEISRSDNA